MKVFDPRRRVVIGGDDEDQEEAAVGRLKDDGYYWLCADCFHHIRETLPIAGSGDLSDNFLTDVDKT